MCLLRPVAQVKRGQKRHEYGVLMHNMEESSLWAICLMTDGRYVVLPLDRAHIAFKKVQEAEYIMSSYDKKEW